MNLSRAELVSAARDSISRGSKSFALASRLFDPTARERVWLLYAWCRACDDLADGQDHGGAMARVDDAQARIDHMRAQTDAAYRGEATGEMPFDALAQLLREVPIPRVMADDVIAGFQLDADDWHPRSADDLLRYCYHVAGAVGCMMALVMGVSPDDEATLDRACDLGLAFQLANISRDIAEDAAADRCYLPDEWLSEMDMPPGQHLHPAFRPRLAVLARRMGAMAGRYEASARVGAAAIPLRSRWAVLAAAGIYGDIARQVAALRDHAWDHRAFTTKAAKFAWVARAGGQAIRNAPPPASRDGLWTRPRPGMRA